MPISKTVLRLGGLAAAITAIVGVMAFAGSTVRPLADTDAMPWAGQDRVSKLDGQVAFALGAVLKTQAALQRSISDLAAHQVDSDLALNEARQGSLRRDVIELQSELSHHPADSGLQGSLARDQTELNGLKADHAALSVKKSKRR